MLHDDAIDLVGQEDVVSESDAGLKVPLGVRDDIVAPALARVKVDALLEGGAAVGEAGQGGGEPVEVRQEKSAKLELSILGQRA